ncbi:MAG: DNA polymerase III subunit delta [Pseudomonadota bacterium]
MAVIKPSDVGRLTQALDRKLKAILIHGNDVGLVRELAAKLVAAKAGSTDDPFNVVRIDDGAIKDDPALLADEAQAISLMGGERAIWVRGAGSAFTNAIKTYLAAASGDALIVAESSALRRGAALRELFEKAPNAGAIACYEDGTRDIGAIISEEIQKAGLTITNDARLFLTQSLGADRALSRSELQKLTLYCRGKPEITLDDVEAICGDASALSLDEALDAVFEGDTGKADLKINRLVASGTSSTGVLTAATNHAVRLMAFAAEMQTGRPAKQVVDAARPPVFWKRKDSLVRQLSAWQPASLDSALDQLREAELGMRNMPALADAIGSRALLSISARAKRERRNTF